MAVVAIVMGTYNPNEVFFRKQIASIKAQTFTDWVCVISDDSVSEASRKFIQQEISSDSRFLYFLNEKPLGVFKNFENGLTKIPNDTQYIFFSDQDDVWDKTKLDKVVKAFATPEIMLVHHDLKLIDASDNVTCESCWNYEKRALERLTVDSILVKHVVTGCACAFRVELLKYALPFLDQPAKYFYLHDQWMGLQAIRVGKIYSLREPLTSYRQHGNNQVGASQHNLSHKLSKVFEKPLWLYESRKKICDDYVESVRLHPRFDGEYQQEMKRCRSILSPIGLVKAVTLYFFGKNYY